MNDTRASVYQDKPLLTSRDIRILDIQPADDFDSPIYCTLRVIALDHNEHYQTLSYAWGFSPASKSIVCDGKPLAVTPTIDLALRRIREKMFPDDIFSSRIWIDAICINQADDLEKSKQVAMMGRIYEQSNRLIIWLGGASTDEINDLRAAFKNPRNVSSEALNALMRRPWFERLWVIQEVYRAPRQSRHLLLGSFRFKFEALSGQMSAKTLEESGTVLRTYMPNAANSGLPLKAPRRSGFPSLLDNLLVFRYAKASRAHDRIYALPGISDPNTIVRVDYRMDLETAYLNLAKRHIRSVGQLSRLIMCAITFRIDRKRSTALPSWVPDWRVAELLCKSDPRKVQQLENDMGGVFDHARATVERRHGRQAGLSFEAGILSMKKCGLLDPKRYCSRCSRRKSYITTWLRRLRRLSEVESGESAVVSIVDTGPVLLITHEYPVGPLLDSYYLLPNRSGRFDSCRRHPDKKQRVVLY